MNKEQNFLENEQLLNTDINFEEFRSKLKTDKNLNCNFQNKIKNLSNITNSMNI